MADGRGEFDDVRMRGFRSRDSVEDVVSWIDEQSARLDGERVALSEAFARVLAEDVTAAIDVPEFDRAAMDGFAVVAAETEGASAYNPIPLKLIGEAKPGRGFEGSLEPKTAVAIATGAPLPEGADAVLPAERAAGREGVVYAEGSVSPQKHVGRRGEDVRRGSKILAAGRVLRPQDLGVLASVGESEVAVVRRPGVRIVITGDEVVAAGEERGEGQIFDANAPMLAALVERDGGRIESLRRCRDDVGAVASALSAPNSGAEVILVSGGTSVGADDHAPALVSQQGELAFHGIAMRPSSPTGIGRLGKSLVFLLPGNPVSCLCAYDFFAGRAIRRLAGLPAQWPYPLKQGRLKEKLVSSIGRLDYCRVTLDGEDVTPISISGASILTTTTRADGFVVVDESSEGLPAGSRVDVYLYEAASP